MNAKEISVVILNQLGGNRFIAMTGAKNFLYSKEGSLSFRLPSRFAKDGINAVKISLNGNDLYDIEYGKVWGTKYKVIINDSNVYAEDLQRAFTVATGLDTYL